MEYGYYWIKFNDPEFGLFGDKPQPARYDEKGWWVVGYMDPWTNLPGCSVDDFTIVTRECLSFKERVETALAFALRNGQSEGEHHKSWVIDQMVRILTGSSLVKATAMDCNNKEYTFLERGESKEYLEFVAAARDGEDGPETYGWDIGIVP